MIAVGFPPEHKDRVYFRGVSDEDLMDAVYKALDRLGWSPRESGRWEGRASTPLLPFVTWGSNVTVRAEGNGELFLRSQSVFPLAWIDWGINSNNVNTLLLKLEDVLDVRARKVRDD